MPRYSFGGRELLRAAQRFENDLLDEIADIVYRTARLIESEAKSRAPVNIGNLRVSIGIDKKSDFKYEVISAANYSVWIEYGTGIYATDGKGRKTKWSYYSEELQRWVTTNGSKAQPFWFPALEIGERYFYSELRRLGL